MNKYYAGIGSRRVDNVTGSHMASFAQTLRDEGWILRSGAARGSDSYFELGAGEQKEIFTPDSHIPKQAFKIAKEVHPKWEACSDYARRAHARNILQILGKTLDAPVQFVICWTPDGCESHLTRSLETGGTGQAISLASLLGIPVYNLKNEGRIDEVRRMIDEI